MASACAGMVSAASLSARQVNGVRAPQPVRPPTAHPGPRQVSRDASIALAGSRRRREPARGDIAGDDRGGTSGEAAFVATQRSFHRGARLARVGPRATPRGVRPRAPAARAFHRPRPRKPTDALSTSLPRQVRAPVRAAFAVKADAVRPRPRLVRYPPEAFRASFASRASRERPRPRVPEVLGERDALPRGAFTAFSALRVHTPSFGRTRFDGTFSLTPFPFAFPPPCLSSPRVLRLPSRRRKSASA
jgi:hypothetical protein